MALAVLEWLDVDESRVLFRIDPGTNTHYQLKVGREVRTDEDGEIVDDVYFTQPLTPIGAGDGGDLFGSAQEISMPLARFESGRAFAQLLTCKAGGRAQAVSDVVPLPGLHAGAVPEAAGFSLAQSGARMNMPSPRPQARRVPNRSAPLSRQASLDSLLGELVKVATPVVTNLLKGAITVGTEGAAGNAAASPAGAPIEIIGQILNAVLTALSDPTKQAASTSPVSKSKSMSGMIKADNRFVCGRAARYSEPFIFGIDDALIASLAGPVLQVLPQLMNAANQKRIELKKADNQLVAGILSDINKRLMMDKVLEAQAAAHAQGPAAVLTPEQLKVLSDLLQQLPAAQPGPLTAQASLTASLNVAPVSAEPPHSLSNRAMLTFTFGPAVQWNGREEAVFDRNRGVVLKPRLIVGEPAPKEPLPKAILKLVLQDSQNVDLRVEKTFKLKSLMPNSAIDCAFEAAELAQLPPNTRVTALGELRWRSRSGREIRAYGSAAFVLVGKYFLKERGAETSAERELTDMTQFRAFWNKIWEAPVLDSARANGEDRKYSWELRVNTRYSTLLTATHESNGFMETKLLIEPETPDGVIKSVTGRMKAGMELSVAELNKLIPLWKGPPVLDAAKLEALNARPFLDDVAREFKYEFKLRGRAGQNGMIWVVPTFKLFSLTVSTISNCDDTGQAIATADEELQFPLPVAARLIGLKSAA
jgi:hypothetical protein